MSGFVKSDLGPGLGPKWLLLAINGPNGTNSYKAANLYPALDPRGYWVCGNSTFEDLKSPALTGARVRLPPPAPIIKRIPLFRLLQTCRKVMLASRKISWGGVIDLSH